MLNVTSYRSPYHTHRKPDPKYKVGGLSATKNEYFVSLALETLQLDYLFQVSYWGGRSVLGGQVLDFLVFNPFPLPVQVYSDYWHGGKRTSQDMLAEILIEQAIGHPVIPIYEFECETKEDALKVVRAKVLLAA